MLATGGFAGHAQPMSDQNTQRLDQLLVSLGLFASRSRARDAVQRGTVRIGGQVVTKAGALFGEHVVIEIDDPAQDYVSRAALKLAAALDHFRLDPAGHHCLDVGASTGGFTEVLLQRGAAHVTAIDVGHGQMHLRISGDPRVTNREGLNARNLTAEDIGHPATFIVSDVSFITLRLALAPARDRRTGRCRRAAGQAAVRGRPRGDRQGRDAEGPSSAPAVAAELERWFIEDMGWKSLGLIPSPISGGDGNQEFLLAGLKP